MNSNDLSDEGYPLAMGGPADHWNNDIAIEDKNVWSCNGRTRRTSQWAKKVAGRIYPNRERKQDRSNPSIPRQKILTVSLRAALTSEAEEEFMNRNVTIHEVGFVVTEENVEEAAYIRYLLLYPIVSAACYDHDPYPIPDVFDVDYAILQSEVFDELYLQSKIDNLELPDYELLEDREHI